MKGNNGHKVDTQKGVKQKYKDGFLEVEICEPVVPWEGEMSCGGITMFLANIYSTIIPCTVHVL